MASSEPYVPLFQERLAERKPAHWQFWMLVGCVMVNRAQWYVAQPIHARLMKLCESPSGLCNVYSLQELQDELRPLGFNVTRARVIRSLAWRFSDGKAPTHWREVQAIVGLGQYAADSWAIFVDKKLTQKPEDKRLCQYLKEQRRLKAERLRKIDEKANQRRVA